MKSSQEELTPNQKDNRTSTSKMKQLISKIMTSKSGKKEKTDGGSIIRAIDSNNGNRNSSWSRYDRIEEEPSNINSESIISSEFIEVRD